ncbi:SDR family NAD(P)-dependent oxidoreductase [Spirosoma endophyticum]|uniref:Short-chain dehydrogenase n=1 Tax=Spirosoma endophyticum TaxID=662367 RepID=A0A1I2GVT9_9BACT|nr:SDR family NAD(P)-dependent oxidoreductase [Spirosoma endophyticum]SFF20736.1 Short-chain dehydrogenase [Spirosoma endophyticum]
MQITTKTFVVTGAGSGIGRELTLHLLQKGAFVAGVDINADALLETQELAGVGEDRFKGFTLDITNKEQVAQLPDTVIGHFGVVDGLINNAGIIQPFKPVNDLSMDEINRVFAVNFYGTLYLTKSFLPHFLLRPEAHIANVSSMGGFIPFPGQALYGAAKAAVKLFTEGLYAELRDTTVHVTVVFPGAIATNITENSGLGKPKASGDSAGRTLSAGKAAEQILAGMERNQFRVIVGKDAKFLDWLYRLNPRYATHFIQKKMKSRRSA